jgi:hypothetical protein
MLTLYMWDTGPINLNERWVSRSARMTYMPSPSLPIILDMEHNRRDHLLAHVTPCLMYPKLNVREMEM